jgi:hypothetical protein
MGLARAACCPIYKSLYFSSGRHDVRRPIHRDIRRGDGGACVSSARDGEIPDMAQKISDPRMGLRKALQKKGTRRRRDAGHNTQGGPIFYSAIRTAGETLQKSRLI